MNFDNIQIPEPNERTSFAQLVAKCIKATNPVTEWSLKQCIIDRVKHGDFS